MSPTTHHVAIDLGASSGRMVLGVVQDQQLRVSEVARFWNGPVTVGGMLHWDALGLYRSILDGLRKAGRHCDRLDSVGIDSWGVDFGLLDSDGRLLGNPVHYRDRRTEGIIEFVLKQIPAADLYRRTGIQLLPFNTLYQLVAAAGTAQLEAAKTLLLMPDLFGYWLTGKVGAEVTNASTTQLLSIETGRWDVELMNQLGIRSDLFPALRDPGDAVGDLVPEVMRETELAGPVRVTAVGSHDTASAVVAVPAVSERFAFIASGTWSLVGLELDRPVLSEASRRANFTNERGVDGTVRYLRNVMGLWILQECIAAFERAGEPADLEGLIAEAARLPGLRSLIDVDDPVFLPPGDMPRRIAEICARSGEPQPQTRAALVRCILDSLALAHRRTINEARALTGRDVDVVHLVGGGVRNRLLCQLTADALGLPVIAGPAEATTLGSLLVQARAHGALVGSLTEMRAVVRASTECTIYHPSGQEDTWQRAQARVVLPSAGE
ncbi:MAG: rhamnulokinase family protein [Acidimicrobiales bacterium]|jgi:rhamnulokinase